MTVGERAYLSIGEVLSLLKDEFPDITISKIRFLESQGLLDPERTPSGYRKFYDADVERLRWILRQQREHFLPLKVIKGRLSPGEAAAPSGPEEQAEPVVASAGPEPQPEPEPEPVAAPAPAAFAAPAAAPASVSPPAAPAPEQAAPLVRRSVMPVFADEPDGGGHSLTMDDLSEASGLTVSQIKELEGYGLLGGRIVAGSNYYDDEALAVANLAAGFLRFGVGARHLKAFKSAAEREAGQFEAIVLPLLKQRNPQARQQALDTLEELSKLAEGLRSALLRQALRDIAGR